MKTFLFIITISFLITGSASAATLKSMIDYVEQGQIIKIGSEYFYVLEVAESVRCKNNNYGIYATETKSAKRSGAIHSWVVKDGPYTSDSGLEYYLVNTTFVYKADAANIADLTDDNPLQIAGGGLSNNNKSLLYTNMSPNMFALPESPNFNYTLEEALVEDPDWVYTAIPSPNVYPECRVPKKSGSRWYSNWSCSCLYGDGWLAGIIYVYALEEVDPAKVTSTPDHEFDEEDEEQALNCDELTATVDDYNYAALLECFIERMKSTELFESTVLEDIESSGDPQFEIDAGMYGNPEIDFSEFTPNLIIFKYVLLILASWVSLKMIIRGNHDE